MHENISTRTNDTSERKKTNQLMVLHLRPKTSNNLTFYGINSEYNNKIDVDTFLYR